MNVGLPYLHRSKISWTGFQYVPYIGYTVAKNSCVYTTVVYIHFIGVTSCSAVITNHIEKKTFEIDHMTHSAH